MLLLIGIRRKFGDGEGSTTLINHNEKIICYTYSMEANPYVVPETPSASTFHLGNFQKLMSLHF